MQNQLDLKTEQTFKQTNISETNSLVGNGRAYGLEIMLKNNTVHSPGWIDTPYQKQKIKLKG